MLMPFRTPFAQLTRFQYCAMGVGFVMIRAHGGAQEGTDGPGHQMPGAFAQRVLPLLDRLHDVGCARDKAGNRELHFDDYCKLVLLYTWNPLIDSVKTLQKVTGLKSVGKTLGVKRFSMGSLSEAPAVFGVERKVPTQVIEVKRFARGRQRSRNSKSVAPCRAVSRWWGRAARSRGGSVGE
jgi:hypothetical protein